MAFSFLNVIISLIMTVLLVYLTPCCCSMNSDSDEVQKMTFSPPVLTDEEENSVHLPDNLKCDACKAVAVQLTETFAKAESKLRSGRKLRESEVVDLVEELCESGFEMYGVKSVNGANRLSGPGLESESVPGMVQMGGKWPKRLQTTCSFLIGELSDENGEEELYKTYANKRDPKSLYTLLCLKLDSHCSKSNDNNDDDDQQTLLRDSSIEL